ncbi:hypothetical protein KSS87_006716, partial [Heliosperma pusillum]
EMEVGGSTSLINKIHSSTSDGIYIAASLTSINTTQFHLVQGILHVLQGNSSPFFLWDDFRARFYAKVGIFVTDLSQTGLHELLNHFLYAASCLRQVQTIITRIQTIGNSYPTLKAFSTSASAWLAAFNVVADLVLFSS